MPLLSREVAIETLKLSGLKVNVVRRKDGTMNFSDLVAPKGKDRKPEEPPNLRIADMNVEKVQLAYRDEATGQELNLAELNLKTGRLDGQTPGELSLTARFTGKKPEEIIHIASCRFLQPSAQERNLLVFAIIEGKLLLGCQLFLPF